MDFSLYLEMIPVSLPFLEPSTRLLHFQVQCSEDIASGFAYTEVDHSGLATSVVNLYVIYLVYLINLTI